MSASGNQKWSDERKARVKTLWLDGKSATEIAKTIGATSRSAVLGQVHRMGLTNIGRATISPPGRLPKAPTVRRTPGCNNGLNIKLKKPVPVVYGDPSKLNPAPVAPYVEKPEALTPTATVLTLGSHMCKWPIGDPSAEDFGFCGLRSDEGRPYCLAHARIAYQPTSQTPAKRKNELVRACRRYA